MKKLVVWERRPEYLVSAFRTSAALKASTVLFSVAVGVMASYDAWDGMPMAINPILKRLVQKQWGVDVLLSDGGAVTLLVASH